MKNTSITFLILFALNSNAQNVGIGTANPAEKLDVTGNINVTGTIKANGKDGTANQVLMKNNAGVLQWGDMGEYKNFLTYFSNSTFIVPSGVTKIMVELWGGGGGGNYFCGGGGGGYVRGELAVVPGNVCSIQIGAGGSSANSATAADGGDTFISLGLNSFIATGGGGAIYLSTTRSNPGLGGAAASSATPKNYVIVPGDIGGVHKKRFEQSNTTTFYEMTEGGNGGGTFKYPNVGGNSGHCIYNLGTSSPFILSASGANAQIPGGGGASGLVSSCSTVFGGNGAKGMLIVYY